MHRKHISVFRHLLPLMLALVVAPALAHADSWVLWDWSAYIDGATFNPPALPASVNSSGFDFSTGLGSLVFSFDPGSHAAGVYLAQYFEATASPGDLTNGYATAIGGIPTGLSYQLGWPGGASPTVYENFAANALPNTNTVGTYSAPPAACCDVAMAVIQALIVPVGSEGTITFNVSTTAPASGFYLQQTNNDWGANVYLTTTANISTIGAPEPGPTVLYLLFGASAAWAARRRMRRS